MSSVSTHVNVTDGYVALYGNADVRGVWYAATNVQLQRSEGENAALTPNIFNEAVSGAS